MNPSAPRRTNVLVMHPDPLLSAGLVAALRRHPAFDVFTEENDEVGLRETQIDVAIGDYANAMRLANVAVRATDRRLAAARIMALTLNDREADIRRAIEAGVHGYLLLGVSLDELIEGVTRVALGVRHLSQKVAQRMADSLTRTSLTLRETEVLRLAATGESNKAIARQLHIALGTVKSHMSAIMTKLGASSRTHAAGIASSRGLVEDRVSAPHVHFASRERRLEPRVQFA